MKRSITVLIVLFVCVIAVGFYRGWFTLSTHPDAGSKKVDVELTMDHGKMEQDAEVVKQKTSELVGNVKDQTTIPAKPAE